MKKILFKSKDRGSADYGWLKAKYAFSFANYYNSEKVNFGALRVLNDDIIEGGMGFGTHPHDNMEIITIPLKGAMKHRDSMSNEWIQLNAGEVQVMSAGTGLMHSEMNNSATDEVNLFQIWIMPNKRGVIPRYDQKKFDANDRKNKLQLLVSSIDDENEEGLKIHQNAKISRIDLSANTSYDYKFISIDHALYVMVISGEITIDNSRLLDRDAIGIYETTQINYFANSNAEILFIEVPIDF